MRKNRTWKRSILLLCAVALLAPAFLLLGCSSHNAPCPSAYGPCYKPGNPYYPVLSHDNCRHYTPYRRCCYHKHYNCCPYYYW